MVFRPLKGIRTQQIGISNTGIHECERYTLKPFGFYSTSCFIISCTVCPRSLVPIYMCNLLYNMGHVKEVLRLGQTVSSCVSKK